MLWKKGQPWEATEEVVFTVVVTHVPVSLLDESAVIFFVNWAVEHRDWTGEKIVNSDRHNTIMLKPWQQNDPWPGYSKDYNNGASASQLGTQHQSLERGHGGSEGGQNPPILQRCTVTSGDGLHFTIVTHPCYITIGFYFLDMHVRILHWNLEWKIQTKE